MGAGQGSGEVKYFIGDPVLYGLPTAPPFAVVEESLLREEDWGRGGLATRGMVATRTEDLIRERKFKRTIAPLSPHLNHKTRSDQILKQWSICVVKLLVMRRKATNSRLFMSFPDGNSPAILWSLGFELDEKCIPLHIEYASERDIAIFKDRWYE